MKIQKLKHNRSSEQRKITLAEKYAAEGKATGGGRMSPKKVAGTLEARNIPVPPARVKGGRLKK